MNRCPLNPDTLFDETCAGRLVIDGEGPDEVRRCTQCGAQWSLDSKESD